MPYLFEPDPPASLPVAGRDALFPVHRVYCVARNYAAHAREMGGDPDREPPAFFMKPADAVVAGGGDVPYPPATANLHHEIELVAAIGRGGRNIPVSAALDHVFGYAVGLDLTRRDLQTTARTAGGPWDMAKGFDRSAPCGAVVPAAEIGHPRAGAIRLAVNGAIRQDGDLRDLIWSVAETVAQLSTLVELRAGDLLFTGTPEGVGPVVAGDVLDGHIDGVGDLHVAIR
jgi:fumarylpyruvate hydrolase